jgi:hypothetical protein
MVNKCTFLYLKHALFRNISSSLIQIVSCPSTMRMSRCLVGDNDWSCVMIGEIIKPEHVETMKGLCK